MEISKLLLATIGATVLLGAFVGSASARTLSSSSLTMRKTFTAVTFNGAFGNIVCAVTVEGSSHSRTIAKVAGTLVGYITRADLGACATGRATILRETLPWHVRYAAFTGVLPNITAIRANVIGVSFRIQEPFAGCLARSTVERPAIATTNREAGGVLTSGEIGGSIPTSCGISGSLSSDRGTAFALGTTARITVTLI